MNSDSQEKINSSQALELDSDLVASYLEHHPDFFIKHEELLALLTIPHESGGAISLLERQVDVLRGRSKNLQSKISNFIANATRNDVLFEKTRALILDLLKATSISELARKVEKKISTDFDAVESKLIFIENDKSKAKGLNTLESTEAKSIFGELFEKKRTYCGKLEAEKIDRLFSNAKKNIVSVAIVPVHINWSSSSTEEPSGTALLIIGSDQKGHFNTGLDTLFLDFIGEVIASLIVRLGF